MYESPIKVFMEQASGSIAEEFDAHVRDALGRMSICVDEEELIKALQYDRGQYEKGYADGYAEGRVESVGEILRRFYVAPFEPGEHPGRLCEKLAEEYGIDLNEWEEDLLLEGGVE